jgi:GNAT superfamily N-acetyltransferase
MTVRVEPFSAARRDDFLKVHSPETGAGWCFCVAWWVDTWEGWGDRTAEDNLELRERLCDRGEYDGFLLYVDDAPVGWCQVGPRDRLEKLRHQFELAPAPDVWAVTCYHIAPEHRRRGLAGQLLDGVIEILRERGVRRLEAFPRRGGALEPGEMWTGPETLYLSRGFTLIRDDDRRPVYGLDLQDPSEEA